MELFTWIQILELGGKTSFRKLREYAASSATGTGTGTQALRVDPVFAFAA
jgi:hypothetical protein